MNPITHLLIGWTVANSVPSLNRRERALVTWASVIPDIDGLGIVAEVATRNSAHPLNWWSDYHHLIGHNIGFALLVTALFTALASHRRIVAPLVFLSFHLHLLGDLVGARGPDCDQWPIPYLLPFSNAAQLRWSGQWPLNAWQNIVLSAGLMALAMVLAVRRGYSPVQLFSSKVDGIVVSTIKQRVS